MAYVPVKTGTNKLMLCCLRVASDVSALKGIFLTIHVQIVKRLLAAALAAWRVLTETSGAFLAEIRIVFGLCVCLSVFYNKQ